MCGKIVFYLMKKSVKKRPFYTAKYAFCEYASRDDSTSSLTDFHSVTLLTLKLMIDSLGCLQASQTVCQLYSGISPQK